MAKVGVVIILVILSFFINLLYYTCWMLTDAWLLSDEPSNPVMSPPASMPASEPSATI